MHIGSGIKKPGEIRLGSLQVSAAVSLLGPHLSARSWTRQPEPWGREAHEPRVFFVRTLSSQGFPDEEIANRLGQKSGADLITNVYGEREVGWIGCKAQDWLPEDPSEVA